MSWGLQVFGPTSSIVIDDKGKIGRIAATIIKPYPVDPEPFEFTIEVPGMRNNGEWEVLCGGIRSSDGKAIMDMFCRTSSRLAVGFDSFYTQVPVVSGINFLYYSVIKVS